ncbi:SYF2 splicing factor-domain-containing protein [Suillus variegatus]|nr:SYF2 splicing factor-domain-containing protein [Suillus variegatus]
MSSLDGEEKAAGEVTITMNERKAKLEQLRAKMRSSTKANRAHLIEESARAKITVRDAARLERQRKLAEVLRTQAEAEDRGRTWDARRIENGQQKRTTIGKEESEKNDTHAARRRYKKDLDLIKPDLTAYSRQKEVVLGLAPGSLANSGSSSSALIAFNPSGGQIVPSAEQRRAAESFYRDANTLLYADNKPTEDAIDRVVAKMNRDIDKKGKFSRKRLNEDEGDIT